jgi:hypothetical protein
LALGAATSSSSEPWRLMMIKVTNYSIDMTSSSNVNQDRFCPSRALSSLAIVAAFFLSINSPARSDACASASAADEGAACAIEIRRSYVDATRIYEVSPDIEHSAPWISQAAPSTSPAPFALNPTEAGVSVRASFGQVRDYNAQMTAKKIEAAKAFAPKVAPGAAPPPAQSSPLDVWSSVDIQGLDGVADESRRAGAGADYKLNKSTTVGVVAERGEASVGGVSNDESKFGAYMAFRAAPAVTIDARTEWHAAHASGAEGTEKSTVSIAPRLAKPFALDGGASIEPFVTYKHAFDVGSEADQAAVAQSAGAGLTYAKPESYSLSVTTDLENVGGAAETNLNSKLQLKLPIP